MTLIVFIKLKDFFGQTVNSYLVWGGIAIHYADQYSKVEKIVFVFRLQFFIRKFIFCIDISLSTMLEVE